MSVGLNGNDSKPFSSITKALYCQRSGVLLGEFTVLILEGHMPYLQVHSESIWLHPFYNMDPVVLMKKMEDQIKKNEDQGWTSTGEFQRLGILMSALMWKMDCIKQDRPTLPPKEVIVGSSDRVLKLARWFYNVSSQRLRFPIYSISQKNDNLDWQNFRFWIGEAFTVKHNWGTQSRDMAREAQKKAFEAAMKDIVSEPVKRVDQRKVWNWIDLQLEGRVHVTRRELWKKLFIEGDINYTDWLVDDVDDLEFAMAEHCDLEYHIMPYIRMRLKGIKGLIQDFYSGFTLVSKSNVDQFGGQGLTQKEAELLGAFDEKAAALDSMPNEPQRGSFQSMGLFMKAQAEYRILKKRFEAQQARKQQPPAGGNHAAE